jgi:uncharacterized protein (DUF433 family)
MSESPFTLSPEILGDTPVFVGTRVPVKTLKNFSMIFHR